MSSLQSFADCDHYLSLSVYGICGFNIVKVAFHPPYVAAVVGTGGVKAKAGRFIGDIQCS